ncbi:slr5012 (plasmid) [Synechocystis sp. PCC 6803]|uniref:Slr5012 protein n=1 Tax=Synechocystis sp. (strain ATCC 27184 / PCC 6803 / Kazusa) TaxID=1111708 RepID=Q6ZEW8_SYNY3|nr:MULTISPECIES: DUF4007 family protein [unclassified Synechocystis]AGF53439.1 hypothetical protein MYO_2130 [Synechocystis sp. PCC 6803]AVP91568.1 DUF4007 domain-containing protein [Synechocystis sp. IPPAS B-1465]MBD2619998.1 DUF4007 family protein [Synechocystis sp. FACHB-898]MBD2640818.1 DUF4007 family protein [Synechocystis sp. FACHB-908]MBD2662748.1 DUF4007 family protein [Synechocystis sp. FACHB-929]
MKVQLGLDIPKHQNQLKPIFARHETFHPRFGWLKKGFDRARDNSRIFLAEDAPVLLGVGKNMVRSIRYWCEAFKLLDNDQPTLFGETLLGNQGWDPYLEDPASLWLLHWKLLEPPCLASAWWFTFNQFNRLEFTDRDLFDALVDYGDRLSGNIAESSLKKDVSCLLRMYAKQPNIKKFVASEESLDCPFVDLGLINPAGGNHRYLFRLGYKPTLVPAVILYSVLHYAQRVNETARTIPLARLLYDEGSPGMVFKLTESSLCGAIEAISRTHNQLGLEDAAGKLQFWFDSDPMALANQVLETYYADI